MTKILVTVDVKAFFIKLAFATVPLVVTSTIVSIPSEATNKLPFGRTAIAVGLFILTLALRTIVAVSPDTKFSGNEYIASFVCVPK
jgi:hypothetical protein